MLSAAHRLWAGLLAAAPLVAGPLVRLETDLEGGVRELLAEHPGKSAAVTLERGERSLLARAWLADRSVRTLDVQYFIWTGDNVGRLAMDGLLRAAERGVKVRVLVDDLLLDVPADRLAALDGHPNLDIRVYNPNTRTGVGTGRKVWNALTKFRAVNQRMHNKALIVDGLLAVTGGRNLADEYYDFDPDFNFRDRDLLVAGPVVGPMQAAFDEYWASGLSRPVGELIPALAPDRQAAIRDSIRAYAADTANFDPGVRRAIDDLPKGFADLAREFAWSDAVFVTDPPGKNLGKRGLGGGGATTAFLANLVRSAEKTVTIQSPYLIPDDSVMAVFRALAKRGVKVRVSTNSLANNDNLQAVSGYRKRRKQLLKLGVGIYEFKPEPDIQPALVDRYGKLAGAGAGKRGARPVFVLHAKTLVVDGKKAFIGTFNLDPRSMNLNTESGILIDHPGLAREVEQAIEADMAPANSWDASKETGDAHAPFMRRLKVRFWGMLPLEPIL